MHHTCGSVVEIIPDMIDCGLEVLQSVQPEAHDMSRERLKERFGENLAFHGGVSIQQTMPFKGPADIDAEVARLADTLGRGGGYIFGTAHNVQADVPVENVQALMRAYHRHGSYA